MRQCRAGRDHRRRRGRESEVGGQKLLVAGVNDAVEIGIGADQITGMSGRAPEGGHHQLGVRAVHRAVAVDIASNVDAERVRAARRRVQPG